MGPHKSTWNKLIIPAAILLLTVKGSLWCLAREHERNSFEPLQLRISKCFIFGKASGGGSQRGMTHDSNFHLLNDDKWRIWRKRNIQLLWGSQVERIHITSFLWISFSLSFSAVILDKRVSFNNLTMTATFNALILWRKLQPFWFTGFHSPKTQ